MNLTNFKQTHSFYLKWRVNSMASSAEFSGIFGSIFLKIKSLPKSSSKNNPKTRKSFFRSNKRLPLFCKPKISRISKSWHLHLGVFSYVCLLLRHHLKSIINETISETDTETKIEKIIETKMPPKK